MPTYQYACTECGHALEAQQSFTDEPLSTCPECSGRLRKVFSAVGVVFKGSGFYRTDSRKEPAAAGASADGAKSDGSTSDGSKSDGSKSDGAKSGGAASDGGSSSSTTASSTGSSTSSSSSKGSGSAA